MSAHEIRLPDGLDAEEAADVLREFGSTDDAQIVSGSRLDSLETQISEAKEAFATVLAEESPQSADTLSRQDMDALTEPYRNDDGDIDVDTLRQTPQTGDVGGDEGGDGFDPNGISLNDRDELDTLEKKRSVMASRGMENRAGEIESEMADLVGAPDYETLAAEVF